MFEEISNLGFPGLSKLLPELKDKYRNMVGITPKYSSKFYQFLATSVGMISKR